MDDRWQKWEQEDHSGDCRVQVRDDRTFTEVVTREKGESLETERRIHWWIWCGAEGVNKNSQVFSWFIVYWACSLPRHPRLWCFNQMTPNAWPIAKQIWKAPEETGTHHKLWSENSSQTWLLSWGAMVLWARHTSSPELRQNEYTSSPCACSWEADQEQAGDCVLCQSTRTVYTEDIGHRHPRGAQGRMKRKTSHRSWIFSWNLGGQI